MDLVGARANGDVRKPASGPAIFGVEGVRDDAELTNLLDRRPILLDPTAHIALAGRGAVQKYFGVAGIRTVDTRAPRRGGGHTGKKRKVRSDIALPADGDHRQLLNLL